MYIGGQKVIFLLWLAVYKLWWGTQREFVLNLTDGCFSSAEATFRQMARDRHSSTGINRLFGFKGYQTIKCEILTQILTHPCWELRKLENKQDVFEGNYTLSPSHSRGEVEWYWKSKWLFPSRDQLIRSRKLLGEWQIRQNNMLLILFLKQNPHTFPKPWVMCVRGQPVADTLSKRRAL